MIRIKHRISGEDLYTVHAPNLINANLEDADLRAANLRAADLENADFKFADLEYADLENANLRRANLRGVNLENANLRRANLRRVNLRRANLRGVNLRGANLRRANLEGAKGVLQWQSPQGEKRLCYSVKHDGCVMHKLGCFWGSTDEAVTAIREKYGDNSMYEQLLKLNAKALADATRTY